MHLILMGCEYAGKTTLAVEISRWIIDAVGLPFVRWHNHYVVPRIDTHLVVRAGDDTAFPGKQDEDLNSEEDEEQVIGLRPSVLEQLTRHMVWRHLHPDMYREDEHVLTINHYYAEAVYAPLYYGYGEPGSFADRRQRAREWDGELLRLAPDTVLVLVRASADVIRRRMRASPRARGILKGDDVEMVLDRFAEEYRDSLLHRRVELDTTAASVEETLDEFRRRVWPNLSPDDLLRISTRPGCRQEIQ